MTLSGRLDASPLVALARRALGNDTEVWIAGGAVRDAALGREVTDLDLALSGDPAVAAKAIAGEGEGHAFELSAEFATWRTVARDGGWQVDATALRGETIEADLAARDFTLGAVAVPLVGGEPIDPFGGLADLERRLLRVVGEDSFKADPLRLLRAARLTTDLGLEIDPATVALARAEASRAAEPAGERQLAELRRLLGGPDPLRGYVPLLGEAQQLLLGHAQVGSSLGQRQHVIGLCIWHGSPSGYPRPSSRAARQPSRALQTRGFSLQATELVPPGQGR